MKDLGRFKESLLSLFFSSFSLDRFSHSTLHSRSRDLSRSRLRLSASLICSCVYLVIFCIAALVYLSILLWGFSCAAKVAEPH